MAVADHKAVPIGLLWLCVVGAGSMSSDIVYARFTWASPTLEVYQGFLAPEVLRLSQESGTGPWAPVMLGKTAQAATESSQPLRERYQNALNRIDIALEAWQLRRSIVPGFDQSQDLILKSRGKAVQAYLDADYGQAVRLAQQALDEVDAVKQLEQEYFALNLTLAMDAYEAEQVAPAQEAIELAVALRPEHDDAKLWQKRIEQLPNLIAARQSAADAQHAGRLQDEIDALYQVVSIKPNDKQALARIEIAKRQLKEQKFNRIIGQGHKALIDGDLNKARQALTRAQNMNPQHSEIERLQKDIARVERDNEVSRLIAAAEQDAYQDDWYSAQQKLDAALKLSPGLNEVIEGRDLAKTIVSIQRNLDDFVARPQRLNSANIATAARQEIERARPLVKYSPHLSATVETLELELEQWQQPMPVRVLSDGKTHIEVRGVGIIGTTVDRVVMLKPGTYQFEGKKKGYRNKLVEVNVSTDTGQTAEVEIICDEPA